MVRPLTRRQQRQNDRFLAALARTGNARRAARELGVNRATYTKRRARHPAFAAAWNYALAMADATLIPPRNGEGDRPKAGGGAALSSPDILTRTPSGHTQLRRAPARLITPADAAHFLSALTEGATVRAAAHATGFAHPSFYARARRDPAFARELEIALAIRDDRRVWARIGRATAPPESWRDFDADLPIPRMTAEQALMQLMFHRPDGPFQRSPRRLPPRPRPLAHFAPRILAKIRALRRARHFEATGSWRLPGEE